MIKYIDLSLLDVVTLNQGANIDREAYNKALNYASYMDRETYYILHFLIRHLKENKITITNPQGKNISYINVLTGATANKAYFSDENHLIVHLAFQYSKVFYLKGKQRESKFLNMLQFMAKVIGHLGPELEQGLLNAITEFENNGGMNIWIHKKKMIKGIGTAMLACQLTITEFTLSLVIKNRKNEELFRKMIAKTKADIFAYHGLFNQLDFVNDEIRVLSRHLEEPIYVLNIHEMQKNQAGYFPTPKGFYKIDDEHHMIVEDYSRLNLRKNGQWWSDFKRQLEDLNTIEPCPNL